MTKTLSAREVINTKPMKNKTVVGLRIINIVSSHFFFAFQHVHCTLQTQRSLFPKNFLKTDLLRGRGRLV